MQPSNVEGTSLGGNSVISVCGTIKTAAKKKLKQPAKPKAEKLGDIVFFSL